MNFPRNDSAINAIDYALQQESEGISFLQLWMQGEFPEIREHWIGVPESVFIGADPLLPKTVELMEAEAYFEKAANLLPKAFFAMKNVLAGQTSSYVLQQTLNEIESVLCIQTSQHEKSEELPSEFAQFLETKRKGVVDALRKAFENKAQVPPPAQVAGRWRLVPVEPTEEMLAAAIRQEDETPLSTWGKIVPADHSFIYKAMLAAAPQPSAQAYHALIKYEQAFEELFTSCLSNGIFNRWGKEVDCTALNEAHCLAQAVLKESSPVLQPPAQEPYGWAVFYEASKDEEGVEYKPYWHVHIGSERPLDTYGEDAKFFPVYADPQPASAPVSAAKMTVTDELIRSVFLRNGFTVKEGQKDLKPYVFAAARDLIAVTTQLASEPVDEQDDELVAQVKMYIEQYEEDGDTEQAAFFVNILGRIRKQDEACIQARAILKKEVSE